MTSIFEAANLCMELTLTAQSIADLAMKTKIQKLI